MDVTTDYSGPEVIGLIGAVVAGVAPFVPWVTAPIDAGPVTAAVVSTGIEGIGALTVFLAAVAALVILAPNVNRDGAVATGLLGFAITVVGVRTFVALPGIVSPGTGLYLTVAGGLVLATGALLDYVARTGTPA